LLRTATSSARGCAWALVLHELTSRWRVRLFGDRSRRSLRLVFGNRSRHMLQCELKHLVDPANRDDLDSVLHVIGDLGQVLGVLFWNQHELDAAAMRRQQLLLQP